MTLLAFETSTLSTSVALYDETGPVADRQLPAGQTTGRMLIPVAQQLLARAGRTLDDLKCVAVSTGPGSFTGLRIGITVAKVLAFARGIDVIAVETPWALAAEAHSIVADKTAGVIHVAIDAQRGQLFVATYLFEPDRLPRRQGSIEIVTAEDWLSGIQPGQWVTGPGLARWREQLSRCRGCVVPEPAWTPRAAAVARLAWNQWQRGQRDDPWKLLPQYGRPSAAEERSADK